MDVSRRSTPVDLLYEDALPERSTFLRPEVFLVWQMDSKGVPREYNTKRAKLSIDVCAMFVSAKVIFSNFAIARARVQTIKFDL